MENLEWAGDLLSNTVGVETGVKHKFEKHHFHKPTWCDVCAKFIWGIGKQGYKCTRKNCKTAIHFKCESKTVDDCGSSVRIVSKQIERQVSVSEFSMEINEVKPNKLTTLKRKEAREYPIKDPIVGESDIFRVEEGGDDYTLHLTLELPNDAYKKYFRGKRHFNFIGTNKKGEAMIVSVAGQPRKGSYKALLTERKGHRHIAISEDDFESTMDFADQALAAIQQFPDSEGYDFWHVKDTSEIEKVIGGIEQKHPMDNGRCFKIGILYVKEGQEHLKGDGEIFENSLDSASDQFKEFLALLGEKINMEEWEGYQGDMGKRGEAYHTTWANCEIIFHVSSIMSAEQHRRLIGNDVAFIVYQEGGTFPLNIIDEAGQVPQVFIVARPFEHKKETLYQVASVSRTNISAFGPDLPKNPYFHFDHLRDVLFTKALNGYLSALHSPPMNRLFYVPRDEKLKEIAKAYPKIDKKLQKEQSKTLRQARRDFRRHGSSSGNLQASKHLTIRALSGSKLAPKDKISGLSDPYLKISLGLQSFKTSFMKKTLNPVWNDTFVFNLEKLDVVNSDLEVDCWDWNAVGKHDFMGGLRIAVVDVLENEEEVSYELQPSPEYPKEKVTGSVLLQFSVDGFSTAELDSLKLRESGSGNTF